jgi:hypothetical protein
MIARIANVIVDAFKGQPILFALVIVNVVFLMMFALVLREVADGIERRDKIIAECLKQ